MALASGVVGDTQFYNTQCGEQEPEQYYRGLTRRTKTGLKGKHWSVAWPPKLGRYVSSSLAPGLPSFRELWSKSSRWVYSIVKEL